MTMLWNVAPCSLVEIDRRFRDAYCGSTRIIARGLHIALMMEAVSTS